MSEDKEKKENISNENLEVEKENLNSKLEEELEILKEDKRKQSEKIQQLENEIYLRSNIIDKLNSQNKILEKTLNDLNFKIIKSILISILEIYNNSNISPDKIKKIIEVIFNEHGVKVYIPEEGNLFDPNKEKSYQDNIKRDMRIKKVEKPGLIYRDFVLERAEVFLE